MKILYAVGNKMKCTLNKKSLFAAQDISITITCFSKAKSKEMNYNFLENPTEIVKDLCIYL